MKAGGGHFEHMLKWTICEILAFVTTNGGGCSFWQPVQADSQPKSSGLVLGRRPLGAILHSSNEPGELSQWLCHDDSTINIVVLIIIIIIIITVNVFWQWKLQVAINYSMQNWNYGIEYLYSHNFGEN